MLERINIEVRHQMVRNLEHVLRLRYARGDDFNDIGIRLLDAAIFARLQDCAEYGAAGEARNLLARYKQEDTPQ